MTSLIETTEPAAAPAEPAAAPEPADCPICIEPMNLRRNRPIACPKCAVAVCMQCAETYLLETDTPICMYPDCAEPWDRRFIGAVFRSGFATGPLKRHRESVLFERERALLPATQIFVAQAIRRDAMAHRHAVIEYRDTVLNQKIVDNREKAGKEYSLELKTLFDETLAEFSATDMGIPVVRVSRSGWERRRRLMHVSCSQTDEHMLRNLGHESTHIHMKRDDGTEWEWIPHMGEMTNMGSWHSSSGSISSFIGNLIPTFDCEATDIRTDHYIKWNNSARFTERFEKIKVPAWYLQLYVDMVEGRRLVREQNPPIEMGEGEARPTASAPRVHRFIRACCDENCKGYLSAAWKCGLCEKHSCKQCHEVLASAKDISHTCDPDKVATAALIVSESKPCPGCTVNTYKISGCNQMWCTQCKTAWNWTDGRIEKHVHNPHYFDYLRTVAAAGDGAIQRNPMEIRCGREIDHTFVTIMASSIRARSVRIGFPKIIEHSQTVARVCHGFHEMDAYWIARVVDAVDTQKIRVEYMRNIIPEKKFKQLVQMKHKRHELNHEIRDVFVMVKQATTEILYRYDAEIREGPQTGWERLDGILMEIERLHEYADECLDLIGRAFGSVKCRRIDDRWRVLRPEVPTESQSTESQSTATAT